MNNDLISREAVLEAKEEAKRFFSYQTDSAALMYKTLAEMIHDNLDAGELWVRFKRSDHLFGVVNGAIYKDGEWNE